MRRCVSPPPPPFTCILPSLEHPQCTGTARMVPEPLLPLGQLLGQCEGERSHPAEGLVTVCSLSQQGEARGRGGWFRSQLGHGRGRQGGGGGMGGTGGSPLTTTTMLTTC